MHPSESALLLPVKSQIYETVFSGKDHSFSRNVQSITRKCTNLGSFSYRFNLFSNLAPLAHMKITRTGFMDVTARTNGQRSTCAVS